MLLLVYILDYFSEQFGRFGMHFKNSMFVNLPSPSLCRGNMLLHVRRQLHE